MKPPPFDYVVADSVPSAVEHLHQRGDDAKLLAGGQSLVPLLNFRLARPSVLIDLNRIPRLADIVVDDDSIRVGAMVRHHRLEKSRTIATHLPILAEAAEWIAHPQIRTRGTIGGSVAHADASAELPVVLTALGAVATITSTRHTRRVAVSNLIVGHFVTTLEPDEMIIDIEIPRLPADSGSAFCEFARRHGDYAIGGAASIVTLDDDGTCASARIVALGGGPTPFVCAEAAQTLVGTAVGDRDIHAAAEAARAVLRPTPTAHGQPEYRGHVIAEMITRSLTRAAARARSSRCRPTG